MKKSNYNELQIVNSFISIMQKMLQKYKKIAKPNTKTN